MGADDPDDLVDLVSLAKREMLPLFPGIQQKVSRAISKKTKSRYVIRALLDELVAYMGFGVGQEEFRQLNRHYSKIDPEDASSYEELYRLIKDGCY